MKKSRSIIAVLLFVLWAGAAFASPQRIVSLKPNITEILFALGAGDRVVGVTKYCDYPEEAKRLPKIADYTRPFVEPIITLKPDLVIGSKEESSKKAVTELQNMGINVAIFPFTNLWETMSSIYEIGKLIGEPEKGKRIAHEMQQRIDEIRKKWESAPRKRTLAVVGKKPLVVFGKYTYMGEILHIAGAQNVTGEVLTPYPRWSFENVIVSNPEIILDFSMGSEAGGKEESLQYWGELASVDAVKNRRILILDISRFRQSPRMLGEIEKLAETMHSP